MRHNSILLKVRHVFAFIAKAQTSNSGACFCGYTSLSHRCIEQEPRNLWVSEFISSSASTTAWDKHDLKQVHTRTHIPHTSKSHLNANSPYQCTHNVQWQTTSLWLTGSVMFGHASSVSGTCGAVGGSELPVKEESHQCVPNPVRRTDTLDRWKHMAHECAETKHGFNDKSDTSPGFQNSYYYQ